VMKAKSHGGAVGVEAFIEYFLLALQSLSEERFVQTMQAFRLCAPVETLPAQLEAATDSEVTQHQQILGEDVHDACQKVFRQLSMVIRVISVRKNIAAWRVAAWRAARLKAKAAPRPVHIPTPARQPALDSNVHTAAKSAYIVSQPAALSCAAESASQPSLESTAETTEPQQQNSTSKKMAATEQQEEQVNKRREQSTDECEKLKKQHEEQQNALQQEQEKQQSNQAGALSDSTNLKDEGDWLQKSCRRHEQVMHDAHAEQTAQLVNSIESLKNELLEAQRAAEMYAVLPPTPECGQEEHGQAYFESPKMSVRLAEVQINSAKEMAREAEARMKAVSEAKSQKLTILQTKDSKQEAELEVLRQRCQELEALLQEQGSGSGTPPLRLRQKVEESQQRYHIAITEKEASEAQIMAQQEELMELNTRLLSVGQQRDALEAELQDLQSAERQSNREQAARSRSRLRSPSQPAAKQCADCEALESALDEAVDRMESLNSEITRSQEAYCLVKGQLAEAEQRCAKAACQAQATLAEKRNFEKAAAEEKAELEEQLHVLANGIEALEMETSKQTRALREEFKRAQHASARVVSEVEAESARQLAVAEAQALKSEQQLAELMDPAGSDELEQQGQNGVLDICLEFVEQERDEAIAKCVEMTMEMAEVKQRSLSHEKDLQVFQQEQKRLKDEIAMLRGQNYNSPQACEKPSQIGVPASHSVLSSPSLHVA